MLIDHLSHPDNHSVVQLIAQRASKQQQTALGAAAAVPWPAAGSGWFSDSATAAVSAAAGLGTCTLRLLKLLSSGMLDPSQLQMGGIIQKGAFSEVHAGTVSAGCVRKRKCRCGSAHSPGSAGCAGATKGSHRYEPHQ